MSDPREQDQQDQQDGESPEQLPDGSGPASHPGETGDPDQFQG